jgi:hypothetical protein
MRVFCVLSFAMLEHCFESFFKRSWRNSECAIPIVFALAVDPIGMGLVSSLARPGGNITGLSLQAPDIAGKRLELLREIVPNLRRLAVIANVADNQVLLEVREVQAAARTLGLTVVLSEIQRADDYACIQNVGPSRRCTLCLLQRPARACQPGSYQHAGARRETSDDLR